MTTSKRRKALPKGLREYQATLADSGYSEELLGRLLDLPENGLHEAILSHRLALREIERVRAMLKAAAHKAATIAEETFARAVANWSIKELQEATGYTNE